MGSATLGRVDRPRALSFVSALGLALLFALALADAPAVSPPFASVGPDQPAPTAALAGVALAFEADAGRNGPEVDFLARSGESTTFIGPEGAAVAFGEGRGAGAVEIALIGATPGPPHAMERLPGVVNYLVGDDPDRWRTGISTFERVRYRSAYPGIDVDWHGAGGELEYDFRLEPGADPTRIGLDLRGGGPPRLVPGGDLLIDAGPTTVRQRAPVAYQPGSGGSGRDRVEVSFDLRGRSLGFDLGSYDRSRSLVIDPVILTYSTYLGGSNNESEADVAVDAAGSAYIAGETSSTDFDTVNSIGTDEFISDAFVTKLNPAGDGIVYSSYLGGDGFDRAKAIVVDASGAAYVAGSTGSTDFFTVNSIEANSAGSDAFITKLTPSGAAFAYSTYLGGGGDEGAEEIAIDGAGAAYVTGLTDSSNFDIAGPIELNSPGADIFVSKLTPAGGALAYSTYLGGSADEIATSIAVDSAGSAYVGGFTTSIDFDVAGPIEGDSAVTDGFVAKLAPSGGALAYSTYLGGNGGDGVLALAVDGSGSAYVAGPTSSSDLDLVNALMGDPPDEDDSFVAKLSPAGNAFAYSTYLGGSGSDIAFDIDVDPVGRAYVVGSTSATDFPQVDSIQGFSGELDGFALRIEPEGNGLQYSTLLGGSGLDLLRNVDVAPDGVAYVTGTTDSPDFNVVGPYEGPSGAQDAFVAKLTPDQDGDGLPDGSDACPEEASSNPDGCLIARTVTLKGPNKKVRPGKRVKLRGAIESASTSCVGGQSIVLERAKKSKVFKPSKRLTSKPSGRFKVGVKAKGKRYYRVSLDGSGTCSEALSNSRKVRAKPKRR